MLPVDSPVNAHEWLVPLPHGVTLDERHWSQRAWTLQEVNGTYIEAGLPEGVVDLLKETDGNGTQLRDHLKLMALVG